jgi:hypothetical protein
MQACIEDADRVFRDLLTGVISDVTALCARSEPPPGDSTLTPQVPESVDA